MNPSVQTGSAIGSKVWIVVIGITRDLFYLFIYDSFNNALNTSDYITSYGQMISK
jgi:hypothetical protein